MLFKELHSSSYLSLKTYTDIEEFRDSERYARAESLPLTAHDVLVSRASLKLASCSLSLVRTFPRIINGYDLSGRLIVVVPMDAVVSARINGKQIGQSILALSGKTNCTVCEPEGRLVAILSARTDVLSGGWEGLVDGHFMLRLPPHELLRLQSFLLDMFRFASQDDFPVSRGSTDVQETILQVFDEALRSGIVHDCDYPASLARYKNIIDRLDQVVSNNPCDSANEHLAQELGVSVRTLQTASQSICGLGAHGYSRLKRIWLVRRQLRKGGAGLTIKASAVAHGFLHMGEFSRTYREIFGELPSETLDHCRRHGPTPKMDKASAPPRTS
jgi:AraC family transcriptional regulator, ethanolamine operon transcriptional activator